MAGEASNKSASTIKNVFKTMEYEEILEKTTNFAWLKDNNLYAYTNSNETPPTGDSFQLKNVNNDTILCNIYNPTRSKIEEILSQPGRDWMKLQPLERANLIYKLATELRKNQAAICEAEVAARGIHSRDTKRHLGLLTDYLEYYAGFSFGCKNAKPDDEGLQSIGIFSDQTALFLLGSNVAPALAAGYSAVLVTEPKISYVTSLLVELARKVGMPEDTIRLIPNFGDNIDLFFADPKVGIVSISGHGQQFNSIKCFNKQVLNYSTQSGIPMMVFDSADLDSACQSVLNAVWGHHGMLPWNVRNILVQENILDSFYARLKRALSVAKIGKARVQNVDVAYPIGDKALEKLMHIVEAAKKQGIEVFQTEDEKFPLTILNGGSPFTNNVIEKDPIDVPVAILTAFRTIGEAVNLANNSKQGFAASVWTDSLSLANEVVGKLQVTTVWINSHGMFSAEVPVTPYKNSGTGRIGGRTGFSQFRDLPKKSGRIIVNEDEHGRNDDKKLMENAIVDTKKAGGSWAKMSRLERFRKLEAVITKTSKKEHANIWLEALFKYESNKRLDINCSISASTFVVTLAREPRGLVAVEIEAADIQSASFIIAALMEGNGVIVLATAAKQHSTVDFCSVLVPSGVLKILSKSLQASKVAALHKALDVYLGIGPNEAFETIGSASKFQIVSFVESDEAIRKTTLVKSVWSNIGQSFM